MHHSDRRSPYASSDYRAALTARGIVASKRRQGGCSDNAVAESFFATIKAELIDDAVFATRAEAIGGIAEYIEHFYNIARRHSRLGYFSPIEFELQSQVAAFAAS